MSVVSIEGNLGAGKSTLLSFLNLSSIKEPVDEWQNVGGFNILNSYYQSPKRWAFTFQLNAIHSRNRLWQEVAAEHPNSLHYSERSPLADRYVFGEIMYHQGNLDVAEYTIYSQVCEAVIRNCPLRAIVYLKCAPELCLQRIRQRGRKGQEAITLQYLKKVHDRHEKWLQGMGSLPILTIDTGLYDIYNQKHQQEVAERINDFIKKLENTQQRIAQPSNSKQQSQQVTA